MRTGTLLSLAVVVLGARPLAATSNKLLNAGFTGSLGHWSADAYAGISTGWTISYGDGAPGAFSLGASIQLNHVVLSQCTNVNPSTAYAFGASFQYISTYSGEPVANVGIAWWPQPGCYGTVISYDHSGSSATGKANLWQHVTGNAMSPAGAHAASVYLGVTSSTADSSQSYFDDLYFDGGVKGDADGSTHVDVADVFYLVNYLFAAGPLPIGPVDVNSDGLVSVADVFYLINYLFAGGLPPT